MAGRGDQLSRRFLEFVARVIRVVDALPKTVAGRHIGIQLVDACTSFGANYEEGCGAESRADFVHKMAVVLKELKETRYWLKLIHWNKMLVPTETEPVINECEELCATVGKSIATARSNKHPRKDC